MIWPWVWRVRLDAAEARVAALAEQVVDERRVHDVVLAEERRLRHQAEETLRTELQAWSERALAFVKAQAGYETQYSQPVPAVPPQPPLPPQVVEAITARAEVGTPLYRQLVGEARKRLDLKVAAAEVAALVMAGEEVAWCPRPTAGK